MKQVIVGGDDNALFGAATEYNCLMGGVTWSTELARRQCIPTGGKIGRLFVELSANIAADSTGIFTLMLNGAPSALTCTIAAAASTGSDTTNEVAVVAGDLVSIRATYTGTPGTPSARWTTQFVGTIAGESICLTHIVANTGASQFGEIQGLQALTTQAYVQAPMPTAGTFKKLYVKLSVDPGTAPDAYTIALQVAGVSVNNTVTIVADDTTGNSGAATDVVAAGALVNFIITPVDTPSAAPRCAIGIVFVSDTDGESLIMGGSSSDTPNQTNTEYTHLCGTGTRSWSTSEGNKFSLIQTCTVKKLYVVLTVAPGAGKSYAISINKDAGAASGLTVTIADTATAGNDTTNTYAPADGDTADIKSVPTGTPAVTRVHIGLVGYIPIPITLNPSKDTYLQEGDKDTNMGGTVSLSQSGYLDYAYHMLLGFDLAQALKGKYIVSAKLRLYFFNKFDANQASIEAWQCAQKETWVELEATWNIYKTGSNWVAAGGDKTGSVLDTVLISGTYGWYEWDVASLVEAVKDYASGLDVVSLIFFNTGTTGYKIFHSKEYETVSLRPQLVIDYIEVPTVTTQDADQIGVAQARKNGTLTDKGRGNVDERGFESCHIPSAQTTLGQGFPHGAVYYGGYIYTCHRLNPGKIVKTSATNYAAEKSTLTPQHDGTNAVQIDAIIYAAGYLWAADYDGWVYKIDLSTFSVSAAYQPAAVQSQSLCSDGIYVFVGCASGYIGKITISTGATTSNDLGTQGWHSLIEDGDNLYGNDSIGGNLHKIAKSNLTSLGSVAIGTCTDDAAQDSTYVYLGREATYGIVRVTKSDLSISTQSPTGIGLCYGVFMVDSKILFLDVDNNYIWVFESDLSSKQAPLSGLDDASGINDLTKDDNGNLHITQWKSTDAPLIKINKYVILDAYDWTESNSYEVGSFTYIKTGLHNSTTYKYRAKAHNAAGYGYGDQVEFTTNKDATGSDTGSGADIQVAIAPLSEGESGIGVDALTALLGILSRSETGLGTDAKLSLAVALIKADAGSGLEHILDRALVLISESGSGLDVSHLVKTLLLTDGGIAAENSYLHILEGVKDSSDSGSGAEASSLAASFERDETGAGVEAVVARALYAREYPTGALDLAKVITAVITGAETGTSAEASLAAFYQKSTESGSGVDSSTLEALFTRDDTGAGAEAITLLAAMLASDTGQGIETVLSYLRTLFDSGEGVEVVQLIGYVGRAMRLLTYIKAYRQLTTYARPYRHLTTYTEKR